MAKETREECPNCHHPKHKYYTRIDGKYKLGHCKHCDYKSRTPVSRQARTVTKVTAPTQAALTEEYKTNWGYWPPEYINWLQQYGITQDDCINYNISYYNNRVWLPIYDSEGLASMQGRSLTRTPKYLTVKNRAAYFIAGSTGPLIITEDILSAIKASKVCRAISLNGTALSDLALKLILDMNPELILVCLDNDNAQVKKLQRKIKKRLDNYFDDVIIVKLDQDLKACSIEFIKDILVWVI